MPDTQDHNLILLRDPINEKVGRNCKELARISLCEWSASARENQQAVPSEKQFTAEPPCG